MRRLDFFRRFNPHKRAVGNRGLSVETLEERSVLTAGVLAPEPVEFIGPAAEPIPALIGPQIAAPEGSCPLEQAAPLAPELADAAVNQLMAEGEDPAPNPPPSPAPVITSLHVVELFGWVWFEGTVADDGPVEGVTIYFSGTYGDFSATVQAGGVFWSTPFMSWGGDVFVYAEDFELNRSETLSIFA